MKTDYIIITPCKNEEKNIEKLICSVTRQIIKPKLWVIVNDGSTDKTENIVKFYQKKYNWIKIMNLKRGKRDLTYHISEVIRKGFKYAFHYCMKNKINCSFVANLDADIILPKEYYQALLFNFAKDSKLGIASGNIVSFHKGKSIHETYRKDSPPGAIRLIRKSCYDDINGIPLTYSSWDAASNAKAVIKGWNVEVINNIFATQERVTSSADGIWNGWFTKGESYYYLGYRILFACAKTVSLFFKFQIIQGTAFFVGYAGFVFSKKHKIADLEVRNYFGSRSILR